MPSDSPDSVSMTGDTLPKRRSLRNIGLGIVGVLALLLIIGVKPGGGDPAKILRRAIADPAFAAKRGVTGRLVEGTAPVSTPPPGLNGHFTWMRKPDVEVRIDTFDTVAHAQAAFETFKGGGGESLLVPDTDDTTVYEKISKGRVDSKVLKPYRCAERRHTYACGTPFVGAPAIIIVSLPIDADWRPRPEARNLEEAMARMDKAFSKSDPATNEAVEVTAILKRLGVGKSDPPLWFFVLFFGLPLAAIWGVVHFIRRRFFSPHATGALASDHREPLP